MNGSETDTASLQPTMYPSINVDINFKDNIFNADPHIHNTLKGSLVT